MSVATLSAVSAKSNAVLRDLGPDIQWEESYVTEGFPATKITEVRRMIDPTTERAA